MRMRQRCDAGMQKDRKRGRGSDGKNQEKYERREAAKWKSCKEMEKDRRRDEEKEERCGDIENVRLRMREIAEGQVWRKTKEV